jgi:phosphoribosylamine--glycine ligase
VAQTLEEAYKAVDDMMVNNAFGSAGGRALLLVLGPSSPFCMGRCARTLRRLSSCSSHTAGIDCAGTTVVVEEFLTGEEASFFAFIDGENCTPLVGAQVGSALSGSLDPAACQDAGQRPMLNPGT